LIVWLTVVSCGFGFLVTGDIPDDILGLGDHLGDDSTTPPA
jgi:hypothetical protein